MYDKYSSFLEYTKVMVLPIGAALRYTLFIYQPDQGPSRMNADPKEE